MFPILCMILLCLSHVSAFRHSDEIWYLPGAYFPIPFRQYSGYLDASGGKYLHYWFVESQRSPTTDPVVLWLNGGPGCSSLEGLLSEIGPVYVRPDGRTLYKNHYSWNKEANVLFLESPVGVGFSYSSSGNYSTDDDIVSLQNYIALQDFFRKYPQFQRNDFYITGESYGGTYIPTLSVRIFEGNSSINFKGFAIGNGYFSNSYLGESILYFAYYHGIIGMDLWASLGENCCGGVVSRETCDYNNVSSACGDDISSILQQVYNSGLNTYNMYAKCSHSQSTNERYMVEMNDVLLSLSERFKLTNQKQSTGNIIPCIDTSNLATYLNQRSVREALHIPPFVQKWEVCNMDIHKSYQKLYKSMKPQLVELISSGELRGLIYNGDVDMVCNFLGDEWFTQDLGFEEQGNYDPWMYGDQVGGFVQNYGNITFLTVKGAGHMVGQDRPVQALKMITTFLNNKSFN